MADTVRAPLAARQLPSWPARASRAAVELLHQRYGVRWLFADEQDQRLRPRLSPARRRSVSVVSFPGPQAPAAGQSPASSMTAAVERFLESVQAATTRASYAETLARLTSWPGRDIRSPRSRPRSTPW